MEIRINGKVIGCVEVPESYIVQKNVIYEPETIEVTNYRNGEKEERGSLKTVGKAISLRLTVVRTDADDVQIIMVEAVDAERNRVPYECSRVSISALENASIEGFGIGNPVLEENFVTNSCSLYEGRALLVLREEESDKKSRVVATSTDAMQILKEH